MRALVTGGGGFLGSRIALLLRERGHDVTAFGRHDYPHLNEASIPTFRGDIRDAIAIREACRGHDIVFHAAAITGIQGSRRTFHEINVEGTRNVLNACRATHIQHLVYTSTPSVVFGTQPLSGVDETQPYPRRHLCAYADSKAIAERLVLAANGDDFKVVALRPHLIWGPGDPHLIPRVIELARRGQLIQVGDGENLVDITYIDNAAAAHLCAANELLGGGRCAGRAYFISQGEPVRFWGWLNDLLTALDLPRVTRRVSYRAAYLVGALMETVSSLSRSTAEPRMTRFLACQLGLDHYFSIAAARRDFGYNPSVSTDEGMSRLVRFLRSDHRPVPNDVAVVGSAVKG